MSDTPKKKELHNKHRERLRNRLKTEGPDHFEDHQLLEALLFFSIPRKDTNDTAHSLIEQTGSLSAVFAADVEQLRRIDGVGEHSATLIKLVNGIMRRIASSEVNPRTSYNKCSKLAKYFANLFVGLSHERAYLMMLDNSYRLLDCIHVCDGTINALPVLTGKMIEKTLLKQASMVVFAHNHPGGVALPSPEDIETTNHLMAAFDLVGVHMLEHIIISGDKYFPIIKMLRDDAKVSGKGNVSRSPLVVDEKFYDDSIPDTVTDLPAKREDGLDTL
jgi:DNA repair protein RadC